MISKTLYLTFALILVGMQGYAEAPAVLTGNAVKKSNCLPANTKSIQTGATFKWVETGAYATDPETIKTADGFRKLFDGNSGANWKSRTYSKWRGGSWATIIIDLRSRYLVQAVDVWRLHEKTRDTEEVEVLFSMDGKAFTIQGVAKDDEEVPYKKGAFMKLSKAFPTPILAQYVQLRIKRRRGAKQQQLGEIIVWGNKLTKDSKYMKGDERPTVDFVVRSIQSGVVQVNWSSFPHRKGEVKKWKVYSSDTAFKRVGPAAGSLVATVDGKELQTVVYPLKPATRYFLGVTAVYDAGENPVVKCVEYTTPTVVECKRLGDMLAINHFWGGGGARQKRQSDAWETVALDLMAKSPVKQIRWWMASPSIIKRYYERGIGVMTYPHGSNLDRAAKLGINLVAGAANEPDLKGRGVDWYIVSLRKYYQKLKQKHPHALMAAPSSGMEDHSIEWLRKFYEKGGKDIFDVLDLHTYTKIAGGHKVPEGYPAGAPEALFDNMRKIREVTDAFGDSKKPVISTEFGYTNCATDNPSGRITKLTQAQYLVRGLILHYVLGFKRVFIYSFWDEGTDPNYTEHHFGMLDHDLQKKPSFFAFKTLSEQLGNCVLQGKLEKLAPGFGYSFKDINTGEHVLVMWNGADASLTTVKTRARNVRKTDMAGKAETLIVSDGMFKVAYGGSPVYLRSTEPMTIVDSKKTELAENKKAGVVLKISKSTVIEKLGESAHLEYVVTNNTKSGTVVDLKVCTKAGKILAEGKLQLAAGAKRSGAIAFVPAKGDSVLQDYLLTFAYQGKHAAVGENYPFWVRLFQVTDAKATTRKVEMAGTETEIHALSNATLEVSLASMGGRVLDLINKENKSNQIRMDYSKLPNLKSTPHAYGIWDTINGTLKNEKYRVVKAEAGQIFFEATTASQLAVVKNWVLDGKSLKLKLRITNKSAKEQAISYFIHPEYHVGGTGNSVTDVFLLPLGGSVKRLPFWTGLGEKGHFALDQGWWGVLDTLSGEYLKQSFSQKDWQPPRIWFGNGNYNVEMTTAKDLRLKPGQSWKTELVWTMETGKRKDFGGIE